MSEILQLPTGIRLLMLEETGILGVLDKFFVTKEDNSCLGDQGCFSSPRCPWIEGRGRVRRRLDEFGAIIGKVAGLYDETSTDTLQLLYVMAKTRVEKLARALDLTSPQQEARRMAN